MSITNQRDWTHLVRFVATEDGLVYFGQVDAEKYPDVGLAALEGKRIPVNVVAGSQFDGLVTSQVLHVSRVSSFSTTHGILLTITLPAPFSRSSRIGPDNPLHGA